MWCFLSLCSSIVTTWNTLLSCWRMKRVNMFIYFSRGSSKYTNTLKHIARLDKHSVMPLKSCDLGSVYFAERASRRTATFTKYARPTQRALPVMANSMWLRVWRHGCKRLKHVGLLCRLWDLSCIRQSYLTVEKIGGTSRVVLPPLLLYTSGCIVLWISQRESLTIHTFFFAQTQHFVAESTNVLFEL